MSPRRSSRARSSQNPPPAPPHTNSSSSTNTLTKDNRNSHLTNGNNLRMTSPSRRASTVRSESIEEADPASRVTDSAPAPRRSRRGETDNSSKKEATAAPEDNEEGGHDSQEEDVTRCVCGQPEYPGPGAMFQEAMGGGEGPLTKDMGDFFVQCDQCHVWQHGGCMCLTDETQLPDEYYCEKCKPELHTVFKFPSGLATSRYLPVYERAISEGSSSLSSAGEVPRNGSTKNKSIESTKRRATMNSRGAYDEDEMLRRAIEESKEMGTLKRARDDEDDQKPAIKRQRTGSSASSSISRHSLTPPPESQEPITRSASRGNKSNSNNNTVTNPSNGGGGSKIRNVTVKNNKEKELRDKQKEALANQRAEAASKRNARSERRRGEDSPPPTPSLSPSKTAAALTRAARNTKEATPPSKSSLNRKGGRPPARRGRLGRNQYTRDLAPNGDTSDSPLRDTSRDPHTTDSPRSHANGSNHKDNVNGESGRSSKAKTHSARTSMNEMKRRVAAILEFVGRMQSDRGIKATSNSNASGGRNAGINGARGGSRSSRSGSSSLKGTGTPNGVGTVAANLPTANLVKAVTEGLEEANNMYKHQQQRNQVNRDADEGGPDESSGKEATDFAASVVKVELMAEKAFQNMNSLEMMDTLTKELVKWQSVWGVYGR